MSKDPLQSGRSPADSVDLQANTTVQNTPVYPPSASRTSFGKKPKAIRMLDDAAAERGQGPYSGIPLDDPTPPIGPKSKPGYSRSSSWFDGIRKFEKSYENFDLKNGSDGHLVFADGDIPKNKVRTLGCLLFYTF
jgi:hypothetical protein